MTTEEAPYADALEAVAHLRRAGAHVTVLTLTGFDHSNAWASGHAPSGQPVPAARR